MQLYLIRHAESENNARPTRQRVEDPGVTALGKRQAERLAEWMATLKVDVMVTSPFLRTLQTAQAVMHRTEYRLDIWHDVFERGGCFRGYDETTYVGAMGMGREAILRVMNHHAVRCVLDERIGDAGWWGGKDRETDDQARLRAKQICDRLVHQFRNNEVVALLIHADLKRLMLAEMLSGIVDITRLGPIRNVGITKLNWGGENWQLDYFNSVTHLPDELITGNEH
jgi:2,3-bisphosphoglycerate-dependent phosphoglycerate mutase